MLEKKGEADSASILVKVMHGWEMSRQPMAWVSSMLDCGSLRCDTRVARMCCRELATASRCFVFFSRGVRSVCEVVGVAPC